MSREEQKESSPHQEGVDFGGIVKEEVKLEEKHRAQNADDGNSNSDDFGRSGFIRIRSEDDDIFEHFSDDFDEDDDFPMKPKVETSSRKRKQIINLKGNGVDDVPEMIEIGDSSDDDYHHGPISYTIDPDGLFRMRQRREKIPLYLLNPEDYEHDTRRQAQIRRAIITYRHHQAKKEQIILLTDENGKLRAQNEALKGTIKQFANNCKCEGTKNVGLDILDVEIPVVPPRMYVSGRGRLAIAAPFRTTSLSSTDSNGCGASGGVKRETVTLERSSGAASIGRPKEPIINLRCFGDTSTPSYILRPTPVRSVAYTGPTRSGIVAPPNPIKKEPIVLKRVSPHVQTPTMSSPVVKVEATGAASFPTASQLLFASRAKQNIGTSSYSAPRVFQSSSDQVFKTARGLVLRQVHVPAPASNVLSQPTGASTASTFRCKRTRSDVLTPILPKPVEPKKVAMDDMWKKYDEDDDEDELAIISASLGIPPLPKNRKQGIVPKRDYYTGNKDSDVVKVDEFDFGDKYKDVVFEEAE